MRYVSTRGKSELLTFKQAVMTGLAPDGGLLVPTEIPKLKVTLDSLADLSYCELAHTIMGHFIDDISDDDLRELIETSYATFDHELVTPLVSVDDYHILELFHGPTLAFKDVALQFLGNLFAHILGDDQLNIVGATSGDTGSAAIAGVRGKSNINIFVMFPDGRVSPLQERQMTTVLDDNVHNISIEGSFDDCQQILKAIFSDLEFKSEYQLGAVNSVNWARVLAQVVYYFSAYNQLGQPATFQVSVPTGNFGDIFAGYVAKRMGLPISRLILATNQNDILHRFFSTGRYERGSVHHSLSPAMDIQVASNFERYVYFALNQNADKVREFMGDFTDSGVATLNFNTGNFDSDFISGAASDEQVVATIRTTFENTGYLVDPHTAVGVSVAAMLKSNADPLVCLATAHPAKFEEAVQKAITNVADVEAARHPYLESVRSLPTRKTPLAADVEALKELIRSSV